VFPTVLVAITYFEPSKSDANVFAERVVTHLGLNGATASLVHDTFGSASANALAASVAVVLGFLLWGIGIGQIYQDVYARAWGIKVGSLADQGLFAVFFFVLSGAIALAVVSAAELHDRGWLVLVPVWLIGSTVFWLWVSRFVLHRKVGLRALLPGALLASVVIGGTTAAEPLFVAAPLNESGNAFGSFGVGLTIIAYAFVLVTMSLICAVFSPVWADWRLTEKQRRHADSSTVTVELEPLGLSKPNRADM
jgi:membrane protein